jgi:hypothetical protein
MQSLIIDAVSVRAALCWGFRRMGFERGDEFFKQMCKGMRCTYVLFGAA